MSGSRELGHWTFDVVADALPKIAMTKDDQRHATRLDARFLQGRRRLRRRQRRGESCGRLPPKARRPDEIVGATAAADRSAVAARTSAGAEPQNSAPRREKSRYVDACSKSASIRGPGSACSSGSKQRTSAVRSGSSKPIEIVLPARHFKNPLARALIEQRRKLAEDSRNRPMVVRALDALTMEPEGFINDTAVYLGLRAIYHRLDREATRGALNESVDELWQIALQVEDGDLSQAERALKDAQDRLSDAIQKGDDKEIQDAMADLKKRLNDYLNEMQKNAEKENPSPAISSRTIRCRSSVSKISTR